MKKTLLLGPLFGVLCVALLICKLMPATGVYVAPLLAGLFLIICVFVTKPKILDPHPLNILVALLIVTALPLLAYILYELPIVNLSSTRQYFHRDDWVAEALLVIMLQCSVIIIYAKPTKISFGVVSLLVRERRRTGLLYISSVVGMIVSSVMANQTGTIFDGNYGAVEFYQGAGWFGGWPLLFVIFSATFFYVTRLTKVVDFIVLYAIIAFWLFHGNRSEVLVQALLSMLIFMARRDVGMANTNSTYGRSHFNISKAKVVAGVAGAIIFFLIFQGIGFFRNEGTIQGAILRSNAVSENRGVSISTIGPSVYSLVAAIGMTLDSKQGYSYGGTYVNYIYRTLPAGLGFFAGHQLDLADKLISDAEAIGGAHFGAEPYINGGLVGAVLFAAIVAILIGRLFRTASDDGLSMIFLLSIIFYYPRFAWYGNIYMYKLVIVFLMIYTIRFFARSFSSKC